MRFEYLLRQQLKLNKFIFRRRGRTHCNYTVITPEGNRFWLYWHNFPTITIHPVVGLELTNSTHAGNEQTLRLHIQRCLNLMRIEGSLQSQHEKAEIAPK